jgi:integrase/recombinase XerC
MRPTAASTASADPLDRLLAAFFAGRSAHTVDAYTRDLQDFCAFLRRYTLTQERNPIGGASLDAMTSALRWYFEQTPGHANEIALNYRNDLLTLHKSTATTARHLSVVKSLAKYARMTGLITWAVEIPVPRIERTRDTRGPTLATVQAMLASAAAQPAPTGPRDVALLRLAYDLALRIGELARLDVADVEPKTGGLWIFGKGRKAKELVTMPQTSREAVRAWLTVRGTKPGPLFVSLSPRNRHGRLVTRGVYRIIRDLGAAAGVHVRPHGIRHTAITQAIDAAAKQGLSIDVVRHFSRHRSISTLLIYRDELENRQAALAELVSGCLDRVESPS